MSGRTEAAGSPILARVPGKTEEGCVAPTAKGCANGPVFAFAAPKMLIRSDNGRLSKYPIGVTPPAPTAGICILVCPERKEVPVPKEFTGKVLLKIGF
ncbi:unnamed protein product [Dibothriocephalus latus]|uniref:Uncharacterized protein n=1 Tax=Dibothriocephalus latus TaxID=60516 RepID=A0A3P7N628_DIBLA|nr:unnamed protein product [Dibothriocephalus latus]